MKTGFKKLLSLVFLAAVFGLAVLVWYSPVVFKGYPASGFSEELVLAKNYHLTGVLAQQNNQSVFLASGLVKDRGRPLPLAEYLRSFFLAKIFGLTGVLTYNQVFLLSAILYALALLLFTILVWLLFDFKTAGVFSLIYIFSPIGWGLMQDPGEYEFCLIFWALFFIFYFLGVKKVGSNKSWANNLFFLAAGVFLVLSALSAEVTLVFALILFVFLSIKKLKAQLIYVFAPFILILAIFWLPSFLSGQNQYLPHITNQPTAELAVLAQLHVFPDAYTYYYAKDDFLKEFQSQNLGWTENLETRKILANFGFARIGLGQRMLVGFFLLARHLAGFFSLEDFGGPLILIIWLFGLVYLKKEENFLFQMFVYWLIISFLIFSFLLFIGRGHLMDFIWPIVLGIALGLLYLFQIVKDYFKLKVKAAVVLGVLALGLVAYHLLLVNHVVLGRLYDESPAPRSLTYAALIKKLDIADQEVIAIPGDFPWQDATLNYLTDQSVIIFRPATLKKLVAANQVKSAFESFGIKYIIGYNDELSRQLIEQSAVINIAASFWPVNESEVSANKSFLMNLIR